MSNVLKMLSRGGAVGEATDEHFENTVLLLHGDGTNGAQNNTFLDSSTNNFTITRNGNTTQGTFSPFSKPDGRWGNFFDGTGDYLSLANNSAFDITQGDFLIEAFVNFTSLATARTIFAHRSATVVGCQFRINTTGLIIFFHTGGSTVTSTTALAPNQWYHVAASRVGSTCRIFINGVEDASASFSNGNTASTNAFIGSSHVQTDLFHGYISNFRLVKGSGVTSITVPTTPLTAISGTSLLTCQSNRFIDNSSNAFAITRNGDVTVTPFSPFPITTAYDPAVNGGAGYFDGSGDYLTLPADSAFALGTADSCVEMWVYSTAMTNFRTLFMGRTTVNSGDNLAHQNNDGTINWYQSGITATAPAGSLVPNSWNHLAFVVGSGLRYIYVNGVQKIASPPSAQNVTSQNFTIGATTTPSEYYSGYMASVRVVKGNSVYSANFTPPTAPLTSVSGTELLTNFTNAGIFDNTGFNALETVADAQIDTSVKKYGTGSIEFDGTGDWLKVPDSPDLKLGTGNFTIEFWVYLATGDIGSNRGLVAKGGASTGFLVSLNTTEKVVFTFTTSTITSSGAITTNAWNHIAVVREGTGSNQTKIYINGTNDGTGTVSTNFTQTEIMYVGANRTAGDPMKGFIDDLRITKGIARYTSNFTPPDKSLPDIGE